MLGARVLDDLAREYSVVPVRSDEWCEYRGKPDRNDDDQPDDSQLVPGKPPKRVPPQRAACAVLRELVDSGDAGINLRAGRLDGGFLCDLFFPPAYEYLIRGSTTA
jgi:hypothetical protein